MKGYKIQGYHYQGKSGSWWWKATATRDDGVQVGNSTEQFRFLVIRNAYAAILSDKWHQRQKNRPINIPRGSDE